MTWDEHWEIQALVKKIESGETLTPEEMQRALFLLLKNYQEVAQNKPALELNVKKKMRHGEHEPKGYLQWHNWAEGMTSKGFSQSECKCCGRWFFQW